MQSRLPFREMVRILREKQENASDSVGINPEPFPNEIAESDSQPGKQRI
jgi:hypothetical protein